MGLTKGACALVGRPVAATTDRVRLTPTTARQLLLVTWPRCLLREALDADAVEDAGRGVCAETRQQRLPVAACLAAAERGRRPTISQTGRRTEGPIEWWPGLREGP
jgi:hypothetical protein